MISQERKKLHQALVEQKLRRLETLEKDPAARNVEIGEEALKGLIVPSLLAALRAGTGESMKTILPSTLLLGGIFGGVKGTEAYLRQQQARKSLEEIRGLAKEAETSQEKKVRALALRGFLIGASLGAGLGYKYPRAFGLENKAVSTLAGMGLGAEIGSYPAMVTELTKKSYFAELKKVGNLQNLPPEILAQLQAAQMGESPQPAPEEGMPMVEGEGQDQAAQFMAQNPITPPVTAASSPAHEIIAARVEQLGPKAAHGYPMDNPPPGYLYIPELSRYVPNPNDPGWMSMHQALEAARNKGWHDAGQQELMQQQAQQQLDQRVSQEAEARNQMVQQAQQQQILGMQQQQAAALSAAREAGRQRVEQMDPMRASSPRGGERGGRGVTVQIRR